MAGLVLLLSAATAFGFTPTSRSSMPGSRTTRSHRSASALHALALEGAASTIESFFVSQPYMSAFLTCSFKASAADWVAQTQQQPEEARKDADDQEVDVSRNMAFLLYGGLYQGMVQQFMYSTLFPNLFGHELTFEALARQVTFDMTVVGPFLCLPVAYAVKSLFTAADEGDENGISNKWEAVKTGLDKYADDVMNRGLLLKYWALWTPVQFLTFGVIPQHFRVAFVAAVSFFWVFILSSVAASEDSPSRSTQKQGA